MRVLKMRRGFTTNSSSAASWTGSPTPAPSVTPNSSETPLPIGAEITLMPIGAPTPTPTPGASGLVTGLSGNLFTLVGLAILVGGAIVVERFVARKRKKKNDDAQ